ncbi:hypothetical protein NDU88_005477 [Pleurodeles waltl]|uniref:Uncharacterized protein n=1 Tax=Pleurodeles waltl TaxID=8319 RepID=A0AAV7X0S3_PLEWA|nr:hypothetical protein NDU88_005477 [Pleurodeles waltl]
MFHRPTKEVSIIFFPSSDPDDEREACLILLPYFCSKEEKPAYSSFRYSLCLRKEAALMSSRVYGNKKEVSAPFSFRLLDARE